MCKLFVCVFEVNGHEVICYSLFPRRLHVVEIVINSSTAICLRIYLLWPGIYAPLCDACNFRPLLTRKWLLQCPLEELSRMIIVETQLQHLNTAFSVFDSDTSNSYCLSHSSWGFVFLVFSRNKTCYIVLNKHLPCEWPTYSSRIYNWYSLTGAPVDNKTTSLQRQVLDGLMRTQWLNNSQHWQNIAHLRKYSSFGANIIKIMNAYIAGGMAIRYG